MILNSFLIKKWATASGEEDDRMNATSPAGRFLARLEGPYDFWDRPDGDWGAVPATGCGDDGHEVRSDANSAYRIGTKALRRGELATARAAFAVAMDEQHPGAAFRMAVTELFLGQHRQERLMLTVACGSGKTAAFVWLIMNHLATAARWGHEDARRLISRIQPPEGRSPIQDNAPTWSGDWAECFLSPERGPYEAQDHEFYPDVCEYLESLLPAADSPAGSNVGSGAQEQQASPPALPHGLVLIGNHGDETPSLLYYPSRADIAPLAAWGGTDTTIHLLTGLGGQGKTRLIYELLSHLMQPRATQSRFERPELPDLGLADCAVILDPDPTASYRELSTFALESCRLRHSREADAIRNVTVPPANIEPWADVMSSWTRTARDVWPVPFTLRAAKVIETISYGETHEVAWQSLADRPRAACSRCRNIDGRGPEALPYGGSSDAAGEIAFNATRLAGVSIGEIGQSLLVFEFPSRCHEAPTERFSQTCAERVDSRHLDTFVSECTECGPRLAGASFGIYVTRVSAEPPGADPLSSPDPVGSLAGALFEAEENA
ncbi:hypothetical protein [Streptomyces hokutonensis]|uniref:hypothetical protein n=1 Tax=Streptomyces hokutonensis TaxID=1306990 RepID=UPI00039BD2F7|nr:hypothetical protein [Streptomyces hokutonensis]